MPTLFGPGAQRPSKYCWERPLSSKARTSPVPGAGSPRRALKARPKTYGQALSRSIVPVYVADKEFQPEVIESPTKTWFIGAKTADRAAARVRCVFSGVRLNIPVPTSNAPDTSVGT